MLTKIDIAALRRADRLVFRHTGGKSQIEAIKEAKKTERDPFASDVVHIVACDFRLNDYADGAAKMTHDARVDGRFEAFEMIWRYHHGETSPVDTFAASLRPGDEIRLEWLRDAGQTSRLAETNFHVDELRAHIKRAGARLVFNLDFLVCEDNTARMIRVPWSSTYAAVNEAEAVAA